MSDFIIPSGKEFQFNVKIIQEDSFIAQDMEMLDEINSSLVLREYVTDTCVEMAAGEITFEKVPDDNLEVVIATYADLPITGSLTAKYYVAINAELVEVNTESELPVVGAVDTVYYAADTGVYSIWNGAAYESTTIAEQSAYYLWNGSGYEESVENIVTYRSGLVKVTLADTYTAKLNSRRGELIDGRYLKPAYEGIFTIAFTDADTKTRTVVLDNIYIIDTTCGA